MADVEIGTEASPMAAEASRDGFKITRGVDAREQDSTEARKKLKDAEDAVGKRGGDTPGGGDGDASGDDVGKKDEPGAGDKDTDADAMDFSDLKQPESLDPEDPESIAAWDSEYLTEGDFNLERFQKEVSKNMAAEGGSAVLDEKTYEYLKLKGVGKKVVDQVIADRLKALKADEHDKVDQDFKVFDHVHSMEVSKVADGSVVFREAIEWARKGYSEAARERFNKIMSGEDLEAKQDAAELLVNKYARSDAFKATEEARIKANRKREPTRDATNARGAPSGASKEVFATRDEWRAARKAAKGDLVKLREIDRIRKNSGF